MRDQPNILFLMPDQLRHDFLGCYGASFVSTPHIDALAARGIRYRNAYSQHPVCVPARAALLTGMNAAAAGVLDNSQWLRPDYAACGIRTWPELLEESGYHTLAAGKMHFYPWEAGFGFRERIIAEDKLWGFIEDDYAAFLAEAGYCKRDFVRVAEYHQHHMACTSPHPWEYSVDHYVGHETARWIRDYDKDAPFAIMVGFPGPHSPYDPAAEYAGIDPTAMPEPLPGNYADTGLMNQGRPSGPETGRSWYAVDNPTPPSWETYMIQRARYAGLVEQIDLEVGRIVEALEEKGILDETVILFSSDHGDHLGDHGLSGKGSFYEASCHVPMIACHPQVGAAVADDLVTLTDVTATLLGLAGRPLPSYMEARPLSGLNLPGEGRTQVCGSLRAGWMLFDGTWKLVKYPGGAHLFNLEEDPAEQHNRIADADDARAGSRLDAALTSMVMEAAAASFQTGRHGATSSAVDYGRRGWKRPYPMPWK